MINGLSLFSGIGGLDIALEPWVRPIAYCENDRYAQSVLLSRMADGRLPLAPIWDDVTTLGAKHLPLPVDIIAGGFPCQDLSVAGNGAGLEGKRSGLFFEILRLAQEIKPSFVFLENVPAIRTRGAARVVQELSARGYDCRWLTLSAAQVGAPHKRERWWLLAHSTGHGRPERRPEFPQFEGGPHSLGGSTSLGHTDSASMEGQRNVPIGSGQEFPDACPPGWWAIEPNVGRVAHGVPARVDRLRGLGNAVVPAQAREAFRRLSGLSD